MSVWRFFMIFFTPWSKLVTYTTPVCGTLWSDFSKSWPACKEHPVQANYGYIKYADAIFGSLEGWAVQLRHFASMIFFVPFQFLLFLPRKFGRTYIWVPIRRQVYFAQIPTYLQHMHTKVLWIVSHSTCVCFVLEIQKKVKKNVEIEFEIEFNLSSKGNKKGRKREEERKDRSVA